MIKLAVNKYITTTDPERNVEHIFGGPYFTTMKVVNTNPLILLHSKSGNLYNSKEMRDSFYESRNAIPIKEGSF